jgi:predicted enzyme related to lactoylglutathione lyase
MIACKTGTDKEEDMANAIVHFEVFVNDLERAKKFYTEVLGWALHDRPAATGDAIISPHRRRMICAAS